MFSIRPITAVALATLLAACASVRLIDTWKDPAFTGPAYHQLLVVSMSRSDANRRVFEDGFVRALVAAGNAGAPSYNVLRQNQDIPSDVLRKAMNESKSDAVLVTRLLRVARNVEVRGGYAGPAYYGRGFGGWYGGAWASMPPEVSTYDVLTVESTLWDMRTDKPVWVGTSEVTDPKNVSAATEEIAKILVTRMKADGVL